MSEASQTKVQTEERSLIKELLYRRVPQIVGSYLATSFVLLQFFDWCASRDMFSGDWTILAFRLFLFLLPSVILVSWFHGPPGPDHWRPVEKVFVPVNVLAALAIVTLSSFNLPFLRAGQQQVTVEDENGNTIDRVIPGSEIRKKLSVYFFDNVSGDEKWDWLTMSISSGLAYDLAQDMMVVQSSWMNSFEPMRKANPENPFDLSVPDMLNLARDEKSDFFCTGNCDIENEEFILTVDLYRTDNGKLVTSQEHRGDNLYPMMDEASVQLRRDMGIPDYHINEVLDLPLEGIMTDNIEAVHEFGQAVMTIVMQNDYEKAGAHAEKAVELDPNFSLAWFQLVQIYANGSKQHLVNHAMEQTMRNIKQLPERTQFSIKQVYYLINQQTDKQLKLQQMWVELYPLDMDARFGLAVHYRQRGMLDEAIAEYEEGLKHDDYGGRFLLQLTNIYNERAEYDKALEYLDQYAESYPDDSELDLNYAQLYRSSGDYDKALEYLEKAMLFDPENNQLISEYASTLGRLGKFDEAIKEYERARDYAITPREEVRAIGGLEDMYSNKGMIRKAIKLCNEKIEVRKIYDVPVNIGFVKMDLIGYYFQINDSVSARQIMNETSAGFTNLFADAEGCAEVMFYLMNQNVDSAEIALEKTYRFSETFVNILPFAQRMDVRLLALKGDFEAAIEMQEDLFEQKAGSGRSQKIRLARCYREISDLNTAQKELTEVLELYPGLARAHVEHARILIELEQKDEAQEQLAAALECWKDADPDFEDKVEVLELQSELTSN